MYSQTLRSSWVGAGRAGTQWDWWRGVRGSRASCPNCSSPEACCWPPPPSWKQSGSRSTSGQNKPQQTPSLLPENSQGQGQPLGKTNLSKHHHYCLKTVRVKVNLWAKQTSANTITTAWKVKVKVNLWAKQTSANTITTAWKQSRSSSTSGQNKLQQTPSLLPENPGSRSTSGQNKPQQTPSLLPENSQGQGQPLGKTNLSKHHHYCPQLLLKRGNVSQNKPLNISQNKSWLFRPK